MYTYFCVEKSSVLFIFTFYTDRKLYVFFIRIYIFLYHVKGVKAKDLLLVYMCQG